MKFLKRGEAGFRLKGSLDVRDIQILLRKLATMICGSAGVMRYLISNYYIETSSRGKEEWVSYGNKKS